VHVKQFVIAHTVLERITLTGGLFLVVRVDKVLDLLDKMCFLA